MMCMLQRLYTTLALFVLCNVSVLVSLPCDFMGWSEVRNCVLS